jgi:hypothetical protein
MVRQPVPLSQLPGDRVDWRMRKAFAFLLSERAHAMSYTKDIRLEEA